MGSRSDERGTGFLDFLPWRVAAAWGNPDKDRKDIVGRLSTARSLLGMTAVIAVNIYTGSRDFDTTLNDELWVKTAYNVALTGCLLPIAMVLLFFLTQSDSRSELKWWPVFRSVGLMIGTAFLPLLGFIYLANWISGIEKPAYRYTGSNANYAMAAALLCISGVIVYLAARKFIRSKAGALFAAMCLAPTFAPLLLLLILSLIALLILTPIAVVLVYVFCVAFWASRTCCWVSLFHPLLTPPLSAAVVTTFTIVSLIDIDTQCPSRCGSG